MSWLVNWSLLKEPVNWLSVALIIAIAGYGLALVTQEPKFHEGKKSS